jgi:hypothetical protein
MARLVMAMLVAASCALAPQEGNNQGTEPPASQPTSRPAARTTPHNPRQAEIYEALLRDTERPRSPTILSQEPGTARDLENRDTSLLLEGTILSERLGRLVRAGDRSEFHFKPGSVADGAPDVMEFNKSEWLEAMEADAEAGVKEFVIWAEVTRYRGRNYLNLLKYRRQVAHGNLAP